MHAAQAVLPEEFVYEPGEQSAQADWPVELAKAPTAQAVQALMVMGFA